MSGLSGFPELKARLKAVRKLAGQPAGKEWAKECQVILRQRVGGMAMPYSGTGRGRYGSAAHKEYRLLPSFKVKAGRMKGGDLSYYTVVGSYHAYFVDHGVKAHSLVARKAQGDRTVFARTARKGHPGYSARPFRAESAREALRRKPLADKVVAAWNAAA